MRRAFMMSMTFSGEESLIDGVGLASPSGHHARDNANGQYTPPQRARRWTSFDFWHFHRDLAVLIGDQGGMLDDIEAGISNTAEHTTTANNELKKAAANQKKARRTMCCLVTVLILVGTLIVLVLTKAI